METGKTVRGGVRLAYDAAHGVTEIVEGMYRNIAAAPLPFGEAPGGRTAGIAGLVHASVRRVIGLSRTGSDALLGLLSPGLDRRLPPGPAREAAISALNGVCGDHLSKTGNPLAIDMRLRVLLPPVSGADAPATGGHRSSRTAAFYDAEKRAVEVLPEPEAYEDKHFAPTGKLLILAHGLCMNDREWTSQQHNHADELAEHGGYTPVYVLYNSGRNISINGRALSSLLEQLLETWPVPVESVSLIGFSMGGLLTRSAMHIAKEEEQAWLHRVDRAVYIGTPHHGAVMERGGYWLQRSLTFSPYTAPFTALGKIRSAGITDLRHGNVRDDDWRHHDVHEDHTDRRQHSPLPDGIRHYAIAATLSQFSGEAIGRLLGDGLVHPSSATGRHAHPGHDLAFPDDHTRILYGTGHLGLLRDRRVTVQLRDWLVDAAH